MAVPRLRICVIAVVLASPLAVAAPAGAAGCVDRLIRDWSADGELDRSYPLRCYPAAIATLPVDLRDYSDASASITDAWAAERAAQRDARQPAATRAVTQAESTTAPTEPERAKAVTPIPQPSGGERPKDASVAAPVAERVYAEPSTALPLTLLALIGLSVVLLVSGGVAAVIRRVGPDGSR